jgi:SAM-dependent methyltransferase
MTPAKPELAAVHADIEAYYSRKVLRYGPTPLGVDWSCVPTQELRFVQLLKLFDTKAAFSVNDVGCGYGALSGFMSKRFKRLTIDYWGVDLSLAMIDEARRLSAKHKQAQFSIASSCPRVADYSVASGIFNVKLQQPDALWTEFIKATLDDMHTNSRLGFAVNFLTRLADGVDVRPELYRSPASFWQSYCEQTFKAQVTVIEGYGMREFTLLVRKQPT